jgi:hypothetical protein
MNLRVLAALLVVSIQLSANVYASEKTGSDFMDHCSNVIKESSGIEITGVELQKALYCIAYMDGFIESYTVTIFSTRAENLFCLPEGINNEQVARIFYKYLQENPKSLHRSGKTLLFTSLIEAFPCKK